MKKSLLAAAGAMAIGIVAVAPASTIAEAPARPTLAEVLLSDSAGDDVNGFDRNWNDYDIVTQAVLLFPDLVAAASDPSASLTVFLPTDQAFRVLVENLTNAWPKTEQGVFNIVASLGLPTVKTVLTYHIVGAKVDAATALTLDGQRVATLQGGTFKVNVRSGTIKLIDRDPDAKNAAVIAPNLGGEASNGFAHGVSLVLRPLNLADQPN